MTSLLVAKQALKKFYGKYEVYLIPLMKFLLSFISLLAINAKLKFMSRLDSIVVVLVVALMCSFMPRNFIILSAAAFVLLHVYALSMECAIIVLAVFLLIFLLYFRFSPKDTVLIVLTPLCFWLHIPYVIPIVAGLLGNPSCVVSVGCGTVVYYLLAYVAGSTKAIAGLEGEEVTVKFRFLIDGILSNREMVTTLAAFSITLILVYLIRRLSLDYSWTIAIVAGALVNMMIFLMGELMLDTKVSIGGMLAGTVVSVLIAFVVKFFAFNVDYARIEKVQFEDDEYYYYVKAVPKIIVAAPERTIKKINQRKKQRPVQKNTAPKGGSSKGTLMKGATSRTGGSGGTSSKAVSSKATASGMGAAETARGTEARKRAVEEVSSRMSAGMEQEEAAPKSTEGKSKERQQQGDTGMPE
ncbi:MAG: hypothetical protein IKM28_08115 [Lachnospiraceae bacterium]|nr:hypothetical protein [Lachnospiraceae bacterium]